MLQRLLNFKEDPQHLDASDALAVAVCHYFQENNMAGAGKNKISSWEEFINKNPARVKKASTIAQRK